jgi:hypothetical protein
VTWADFPTLNVTAPYLGREGISITFEGETTVYINTMTGAVTSPDPYLKISMEIGLLKTQPLAAAYKAQMETYSVLGEVTVRPDTSVLPVYTFENGSIQNVRQLRFSGEDAGFVVTIGAYYIINNEMWSLV